MPAVIRKGALRTVWLESNDGVFKARSRSPRLVADAVRNTCRVWKLASGGRLERVIP